MKLGTGNGINTLLKYNNNNNKYCDTPLEAFHILAWFVQKHFL